MGSLSHTMVPFGSRELPDRVYHHAGPYAPAPTVGFPSRPQGSLKSSNASQSRVSGPVQTSSIQLKQNGELARNTNSCMHCKKANIRCERLEGSQCRFCTTHNVPCIPAPRESHALKAKGIIGRNEPPAFTSHSIGPVRTNRKATKAASASSSAAPYHIPYVTAAPFGDAPSGKRVRTTPRTNVPAPNFWPAHSAETQAATAAPRNHGPAVQSNVQVPTFGNGQPHETPSATQTTYPAGPGDDLFGNFFGNDCTENPSSEFLAAPFEFEPTSSPAVEHRLGITSALPSYYYWNCTSADSDHQGYIDPRMLQNNFLMPPKVVPASQSQSGTAANPIGVGFTMSDLKDVVGVSQPQLPSSPSHSSSLPPRPPRVAPRTSPSSSRTAPRTSPVVPRTSSVAPRTSPVASRTSPVAPCTSPSSSRVASRPYASSSRVASHLYASSSRVAPHPLPSSSRVAPHPPHSSSRVAPHPPPSSSRVTPRHPPSSSRVAPHPPPSSSRVAPHPPPSSRVAPRPSPAVSQAAPFPLSASSSSRVTPWPSRTGQVLPPAQPTQTARFAQSTQAVAFAQSTQAVALAHSVQPPRLSQAAQAPRKYVGLGGKGLRPISFMSAQPVAQPAAPLAALHATYSQPAVIEQGESMPVFAADFDILSLFSKVQEPIQVVANNESPAQGEENNGKKQDDDDSLFGTPNLDDTGFETPATGSGSQEGEMQLDFALEMELFGEAQ